MREMSVNTFRGAPFAVFDEFGRGADDRVQDYATEAYAEGRSDEREAIDQELIAILGGSWYMDPPDGGDVPLLEQLRRMAEDARLGREERYRVARANTTWIRCEG